MQCSMNRREADMRLAHSRAVTCVVNGKKPVPSICIKRHVRSE